MGDDLHLRVDQILARLDNVQSTVDPDDERCTSQSEGSIKTSGDSLGAVVVQDLKMHPLTGKTEDYQDPSLGLGTVFLCKDRSEYVSLTVGEWRLDGFEDVRDISFKCSERDLV